MNRKDNEIQLVDYMTHKVTLKTGYTSTAQQDLLQLADIELAPANSINRHSPQRITAWIDRSINIQKTSPQNKRTANLNRRNSNKKNSTIDENKLSSCQNKLDLKLKLNLYLETPFQTLAVSQPIGQSSSPTPLYIDYKMDFVKGEKLKGFVRKSNNKRLQCATAFQQIPRRNSSPAKRRASQTPRNAQKIDSFRVKVIRERGCSLINYPMTVQLPQEQIQGKLSARLTSFLRRRACF